MVELVANLAIAFDPQVKMRGPGIATESMVDCAEAEKLWQDALEHTSTPLWPLADPVD